MSRMHSFRHLNGWTARLVNGQGVCEVLQKVTEYALSGFEQHSQVTRCTPLISAIIQYLSNSEAETSRSAAVVDGALDALKALAISKDGQQVLIKSGACIALCDLLSHSSSYVRAGRLPKKLKLQGVHRQLLLVAQLLVTLLLESEHRPAPGSLPLASATTAVAALQQALHSNELTSLDMQQQQTVAAATARLSMEPAVAITWPSRQQVSSSANQSPSAAAHSQRPGVHQQGALSSLLGDSTETHQAVERFLMLNWENKPRCWSLAAFQNRDCGAVCDTPSQGHQQREAAGQEGTDGLYTDNLVSNIFRTVTEEWLFDQLIATGNHCPVMDFDEVDPVRYLCTAYQQKELLQRLQVGQDMQVIRAASTAQMVPDVTGSSTAAEQVLILPDDATVSDIKAAVAQGFSIVVQDVSKRDAAVAELVDLLEQQLGLPAGANLYYTPAGSQALKPHYDDHCVFVLQLSGSKVWQVACPQHNVLPFTYTSRQPVSLGLSGQQQQQFALQPGHCLYIPRGWIHQAYAVPQAAACQHEAEGVQQQATVPIESGCSTAIRRSNACSNSLEQWGAEEDAGCRQGASGRLHVLSNSDSELDVMGGSLHLSIGVEVEAWFSVQGYLHCLILMSGINCIRQFQLEVFQPQTSGGLREASAAATAAGCSPTSTANHVLGVHALACAVATLLLHLLLMQHADQHAVYRKACPLLSEDDSARQVIADAFRQQLAAVDGVLSQQVPGQTTSQQSWADEALQHLLSDIGGQDSSQSLDSWQMALQRLNTDLRGGKPDQKQQAMAEHESMACPDACTEQYGRHCCLSSADAGSPVTGLMLVGNKQLGMCSVKVDSADSGNYATHLSGALDWIQRVSATAHTAADRLTQVPPGTAPPCGALGHATVMEAQGVQQTTDQLYATCPDRHSVFSTSCLQCWKLAGDVLTTLATAPYDCSKRLVLDNQVLSMAWRRVLKAVTHRENLDKLRHVYSKESEKHLTARRLVRHAHLSMLLLQVAGAEQNPL